MRRLRKKGSEISTRIWSRKVRREVVAGSGEIMVGQWEFFTLMYSGAGGENNGEVRFMLVWGGSVMGRHLKIRFTFTKFTTHSTHP